MFELIFLQHPDNNPSGTYHLRLKYNIRFYGYFSIGN